MDVLINTTVYGILKLNTRTIYGTTNGGVIKEFMPIYPKITTNIIFVSTKKQFQLTNVYAIIKIIKINKNMVYGSVQQYVGNVGTLQDELNLLKFICTNSWANNKIFKDLAQYKEIDLMPDRQHIDKFIVSIDPIGCLDIDDAIHIEDRDVYYEIGVHIADVSSYINKDSELDKELKKRVESIYLPGEVIHMLPPELSTEIYTLKKDKPSRAFSVLFKIDKKTYTVVGVEFVKSLIKVKENLSYEEADRILHEQPNLYNNTIQLLFDIGKQINKKYYNLDNYDVHKMIEIYMLLTNQVVAETLYTNNTECILRTHDGSCIDFPTGVNEPLFNKYKLLQTAKANYKLLDQTTSSVSKNIFHKLLGTTCILSNDEKILTSYYETNTINKGIIYTHFTSPIRRYVDIMVHRMLYDCINKKSTHEISVDQENIDQINIKHSSYHKYERIGTNLIKIYDIQKIQEETNNIIYTANIINLDDEITLYINELDMIIPCKILPKQIKDLFVVEKDKQTFCNKVIIKKINDIDNTILSGTIELTLFQKIKIQLIPTTNEWSKIKIQIIDPDFRELYYDANDISL